MASHSETPKRAGQKSGRHNYNPVNMSGQKAGIVEEVEVRAEAERQKSNDTGNDREDSPKSKD